MKTNYLIILIFLICLQACRKDTPVLVPDTSWSLFESAGTSPLYSSTRRSMEGVYLVSGEDGLNTFGQQVALKWSYLAEGTDTTYYLSVFCEKDIAYFVMEGRRMNDSLLFNGYWRKLVNTKTGIVRFMISPSNGADQLLTPFPKIGEDSIIMSGIFGEGQEIPKGNITLTYLRPLYQGPSPFEILGHRCGGQNSDLLPVSENSLGMIKLAGQLGATGIEMDVQLTKDAIPVLYHDQTVNLNLLQKNGLSGTIDQYTFDQLYTMVRLQDGEHIPDLREALDFVLYHTDLRFVWLDMKYNGPLLKVRDIQQEYLQKAATAGRSLEIVIGLPEQAQMTWFMELPDYKFVPSLCELTRDDVQKINAGVWAPRWTLGLQEESVAQIKSEGRKAFVWTVDVPDYIYKFISQGNFDGILSNYAPLVAYYYYVK
jgi:glycerophosphoryl diester phosphodiesterase